MMPAPQYGGMFWRFDVFGQFLRLTFYVLVVEENTDQSTGFIRVGQWNKTFVFQIERFFAASARGVASIVFTAVIGAGGVYPPSASPSI